MERFWLRVHFSLEDECWIWLQLCGPIPARFTIDHLCRNRRCIRPDHLEAVPQQLNLMRAPTSWAARNAAKTHCKRAISRRMQ
jgi:hypothetical protein